MRTTEEWLDAAREVGFSHVGELNLSSLHFREDVREMCASDLCHSYGRNWMCPPGCGTLEEAARRAAVFHRGILVQTTGALEDDFDMDSIKKTEERHKAYFFTLVDLVRAEAPVCLPLAAGACTICETCAYPEPCRFPERAIPSMEAYGLYVSQVCEASGLGYYYGPKTITFTSCCLID
ncbi:MAG: DUF2284 domain-containing protein [Oscillospiraceae bacterium]|nr:DUF2284 domain-containing protein [Oscillospiraceae bacterium]